jgi:hypothetical protein
MKEVELMVVDWMELSCHPLLRSQCVRQGAHDLTTTTTTTITITITITTTRP